MGYFCKAVNVSGKIRHVVIKRTTLLRLMLQLKQYSRNINVYYYRILYFYERFLVLDAHQHSLCSNFGQYNIRKRMNSK
jgi:hypothetical protein